MIVQSVKWGNSQGVRIPEECLQQANIVTEDKMNLEVQGEGFVLKQMQRRLSFEERIEKYGPLTFAPETDWGDDHGDERWEENGF
ncbi:MAG: AbrB/MazE/SpoVT family DNA-binding domain-containing protein [Lachnospiraceae bacterium]|nr:AbrB/MazE/SpoVT family DNA-binding domain-containing protein [Lachnospiraceae bacterium]